MVDGPTDGPSPKRIFILFTMAPILGAILLERAAQEALTRQAAEGGLPHSYRAFLPLLVGYLRMRAYVLEHWFVSLIVFALFLAALRLAYVLLKHGAAQLAEARTKKAGFYFAKRSYAMPQKDVRLQELILANPAPETQVVLGRDLQDRPVYLSDRERTMHTHCLGMTGCGKTKSVIEPMLFQDLMRGRGVVLIDAKASEENVQRFLAMTAHPAVRRYHEAKVFYLSPKYPHTQTYNPVYLLPDSDPQARAQMIFSTFEPELDNSYYRGQAAQLIEPLIRLLASSGQQMILNDVTACVANEEILAYALELGSDVKSKRDIKSQRVALGPKWGETFTGLLACLRRYDHPAVNSYDPDIVLENEIDRAGVVGFYLPANYYKQLSRYIGLLIFQHIQHIGALRQLDRSRAQTPIYVYADEFYTFAYQGMIDALNKLRDAHIAFLLSHQSLADLQNVSMEFAAGVWDNTRNKIVLYQQNVELCETIAKALGTQKTIENTVRHSTDGFLNAVSMNEASAKEVDEYRLHPNRIKTLKTGQGYLTRDNAFDGLNFGMIPDLPKVAPPTPKRAAGQGLGLHQRYLDLETQGGGA